MSAMNVCLGFIVSSNTV